MQLSDIDYQLPIELIAQTPIEPRDSARLLVDQGAQLALDQHVHDLSDFLKPNDVLVLNHTRVLPARLRAPARSGWNKARTLHAKGFLAAQARGFLAGARHIFRVATGEIMDAFRR